tara:strand:- start:318 stop:500 length:183 start_codon:yes stop_codon:yes gene_type:complete
MYNNDQTGPKTWLGGLKEGKINSEYHGSFKFAVTNPPMADAENVIKSIKPKDKYLLYIGI